MGWVGWGWVGLGRGGTFSRSRLIYMMRLRPPGECTRRVHQGHPPRTRTVHLATRRVHRTPAPRVLTGGSRHVKGATSAHRANDDYSNAGTVESISAHASCARTGGACPPRSARPHPAHPRRDPGQPAAAVRGGDAPALVATCQFQGHANPRWRRDKSKGHAKEHESTAPSAFAYVARLRLVPRALGETPRDGQLMPSVSSCPPLVPSSPGIPR